MTCLIGSGVAICIGGAMEEARRERLEGERWCFRCRHRRAFDAVILHPARDNYLDGPREEIRCASCGAVDADLFPGRWREEVDPYWPDHEETPND